MKFNEYYLTEDYHNDIYYIAYTLFDAREDIISVSINSIEEAIQLIVKDTPQNTQIGHEPNGLTWNELKTFLDKMANIEFKKKIHFKFLYGKNVDHKKINTL